MNKDGEMKQWWTSAAVQTQQELNGLNRNTMLYMAVFSVYACFRTVLIMLAVNVLSIWTFVDSNSDQNMKQLSDQVGRSRSHYALH